jgi:hypothetical protein
VKGRYVAGRYNPNFVGMFPGDNPQYVIVVKLTAPSSSIFAANTAAPVTKVILQAAIAAQNAALDRSRLATSVMPSRNAVAKSPSIQQAGAPRQLAASPTRDDSSLDAGAIPYVVTLPLRPSGPVPRVARAIPDVRGLDLRDAVRSLHSAGFRVQLARAGGPPATSPAAGEVAATGTLIRLHFDY